MNQCSSPSAPAITCAGSMDTVAYHPPAVMCAYQTVGAKQLLFGSDAPPLLPLLPRAKQIIEELPITAAEREDIFGRNALKLLERQ
jgi:predicted TIM-barrel fold metal-dependent hydrolase